MNISAQEEEEINVLGYRFLDYGKGMPKSIVSGRSVILVQTPPLTENDRTNIDWRELASEAHESLTSAGVDAMAYYQLSDISASRESSDGFYNEFKSRQVKNIVVVSQVRAKIKNKQVERFIIVVTPFNGEPTLMNNGQSAWKTQNKTLDKALSKFSKAVAKTKGVRSNLLLADHPEFFNPPVIIKTKRKPVYPSDIKLDKLAVQLFTEVPVPDDVPGGLINKSIVKEIEAYNRTVNAENQKLQKLMEKYPFRYELVNPNKNDVQLKEEGFRFVLKRINASGTSVKYMLGYEVDEELESVFVTPIEQPTGLTLRSIPAQAPVFKYYLKQIYNNDIYLGDKWDADETWSSALEHFITNLTKVAKGE